MKKLILTGLTFLVIATSVFAKSAKDSGREPIVHNPDGFILSADKIVSEGIVSARVIVNESKPFETPKGNSADSTILKFHINCENNLIKIVSIDYLKNNKVIETDNEFNENAYKEISAYKMLSAKQITFIRVTGVYTCPQT
ncbi:hypothetical protein BGI37_09280 [Snodgrassella alvi]|jgi:hypothetical protein|nr:hypothetical protein BGI37_09280 [Snodgrassella alvi]